MQSPHEKGIGLTREHTHGKFASCGWMALDNAARPIAFA